MNSSGNIDTSSYALTIIFWFFAAFAFCIYNLFFSGTYGDSFFMKSIALIVGTILGTIGAIIGDALRRFALPSAFFTSGGFFAIIGIRLFWLIGPQVVGLIIGAIAGSVLILSP